MTSFVIVNSDFKSSQTADCDHLSSATSFPKYKKFPSQITIHVIYLEPLVSDMVATGQEIVREKKKFFKVREKSGNFTLSQGKFTSLKKVREK